MTRNWLTSSILPTKYWYFGIETLNMFPTTHLKNKIITPHNLIFNKKVDHPKLFPLFSVAYIKQEREQGGKPKNKVLSKSLKSILIGDNSLTNGLLFYHPLFKQLFQKMIDMDLTKHYPLDLILESLTMSLSFLILGALKNLFIALTPLNLPKQFSSF